MGSICILYIFLCFYYETSKFLLMKVIVLFNNFSITTEKNTTEKINILYNKFIILYNFKCHLNLLIFDFIDIYILHNYAFHTL